MPDTECIQKQIKESTTQAKATGSFCSIVSYLIWASIFVAFPVVHNYHYLEDEEYAKMHLIPEDGSEKDNLTEQEQGSMELRFKPRDPDSDSDGNDSSNK